MTLFRDLLIDKKRRKYYCEVEYLETTNQQTDSSSTNIAAYIDTGIIPNNNTRIECRMQFTTLISGQNNEALNGTTGVQSAPRFAWGFASISPYTNFYFGLGAQNLTTSVTRDTNVHTFVLDAKNKTCSIDNTTSSFTSSGSLDSIKSIYLFARHNEVEYANRPCNARIYRYRNWDNDQLVQDLIPVLDWSYVPCMYDRVSGKLFYSQGTLSFTYGREIHYVDYLESTGTQYIDTGVTLTNNHSVELDYQLTVASQNRKGLYGGLVANGARSGALLSPSNNYLEFGYGSSNVWYQTGLPDTNRHVMKQLKNLLYFDGSLIYTFGTATFTQNFTAPLGNFTYTNYAPASAKYYSSKWWDGNTLVRDYKPAIDENGVCFWFDKVQHLIYGNAGTGAFKYPARDVEYLESTGTQYINTGYAFTDNFAWEITFEGILDDTTLFGGRTSSARTALLYQRVEGATYVTTCPIAGLNGAATPFQLSDLRTGRHTVKMAVNANKGSVWEDGVQLYNETSFTGTYISGTTQALFADNFGSSVSEYTSSKVYALKMWQGSTLVRDFIPAIQNGVAGMWDKTNNVFYTNAGTGTFGIGKVAEKRFE